MDQDSEFSKLHESDFFIKNSTLAYKGVRFDVRASETTSASGKIFRREAVIHPGAVVILGFSDDERVVMIRNERFAVGTCLWELPAGTREPNETPECTARRELQEETGYLAKEIELLTTFYTSPGFCNEVMYAYVAKGLEFVGQHLDETEKIKVKIFPLKDVLAMVKEGLIYDAKTLVTLLFYSSLSTFRQ